MRHNAPHSVLFATVSLVLGLGGTSPYPRRKNALRGIVERYGGIWYFGEGFVVDILRVVIIRKSA
jgi:hypothetical protein